MFFKTLFVALIAGHAAATPTRRANGDEFTIYAVAKSVPEIHLKPIHGQFNQFWINRETVTGCPDSAACAAQTETVLVAGSGGSQGMFNMSVTAPGGQFVYLLKNGYLSYSKAGSYEVPENSDLTGFGYVKPSNGQIGYIKFQGGEFAACVFTDATWAIKILLEGEVLFDNCQTITIGAVPYVGTAKAYSYE